MVLWVVESVYNDDASWLFNHRDTKEVFELRRFFVSVRCGDVVYITFYKFDIPIKVRVGEKLLGAFWKLDSFGGPPAYGVDHRNHRAGIFGSVWHSGVP